MHVLTLASHSFAVAFILTVSLVAAVAFVVVSLNCGDTDSPRGLAAHTPPNQKCRF
jgi:hypothetical protein